MNVRNSIIESSAAFDKTGIYRYSLTRKWDNRLPKITYILLNPSYADDLKCDNTFCNCLNYAIDMAMVL